MAAGGASVDVGTFLTRPDLFLRDVNLDDGMAEFVPMNGDCYARSSFLDSRIRPAEEKSLNIPIDRIASLIDGQAPSQRPVHFIFHVGHCGSTLVSRLLGEVDGLFSLREPPPLRTLAWQSRLADTRHAALSPEQWRSLLATVMILLGRTYHDSDTSLVKATSYCTRIMEPLLGWHPESRAVLLHIGLERYLNAMLRDEYHTEINRYVTEFYSADVKRLFQDQCPPIDSLSIGQRAALILLAHRFYFESLARNPAYAGRLLSVDFDEFLAEPADGLAAMTDFLGRPLSPARCQEIIDRSGHMTRHAKVPDLDYSPEARQREMRETRARRGDDIEEGLRWAEEMTALVSAAG